MVDTLESLLIKATPCLIKVYDCRNYMFNAQPGSIFRLATGNSEQNKVTLQLNSPLEVSWDQFRLT